MDGLGLKTCDDSLSPSGSFEKACLVVVDGALHKYFIDNVSWLFNSDVRNTSDRRGF